MHFLPKLKKDSTLFEQLVKMKFQLIRFLYMNKKKGVPLKSILVLGVIILAALPFPSCTTNESDIKSSLDSKEVGVSANGLLASNRFDKLVVNVLFVKEFEPEQETLDSTLSFLGMRLNKPNGIEIVMTEVKSPGLTSYTLNDIRVMEAKNRSGHSEGKTLVVSLFFADKDYAGNTDNQKVLGIAYANTSLVIFEKTIQALTEQITDPDRVLLERTVVNHEFGHIMGLVNVGSNMQKPHQDEAHGKHCDNEDCLMNWVAETGSFADKLLGLNKVPIFDQNCLDDLRANGGK